MSRKQRIELLEKRMASEIAPIRLKYEALLKRLEHQFTESELKASGRGSSAKLFTRAKAGRLMFG